MGGAALLLEVSVYAGPPCPAAPTFLLGGCLSDSAISVALASPMCILKLEHFLCLSVFLKMWSGVFLLGWDLLFYGLPRCPGGGFRAPPAAVHRDRERGRSYRPCPP